MKEPIRRVASLSCIGLVISLLFLGLSQCNGRPAPAPPPPQPAPVVSPAELTEQLLPISDQKISSVPHKKPHTYLDEYGTSLDGYYDIYRMAPVPDSDDGSMYQYASTIGHMQQGLMQGMWKTHFLEEDGDLDYTEMYQDGFQHGAFIVYNSDSTVHYQTTFNHGSGVWKLFYSTGQIKQAGTYEQAQKQGGWLRYAPSGEVTEHLIYDKDKVREQLK